MIYLKILLKLININSNEYIIMEFKSGQILNFRWNGTFGKLIQIYNLREYNEFGSTHSAIVGKVNKYTVIVYEALSQGFVKRTYGKGELNTYIKSGYCKVGTSNLKLNNISKVANKYLGRTYGWVDIFYIGLYALFGKTILKVSTNAKSLICSEAVARVLYESSNGGIDFQKEFKKHYSFIAPIDLEHSKQIKFKK